MRLGDWVVCLSITLNLAALACYAYQKQWANAFYWLAAFQLNLSLLWLK